ncbi:MAG TPA: hypothetical protein VGO61_06470 [Steroidobacteraceae bacterium]|jgi:hypothetical protein|nr:hypothetical protein [Steroidobacteraceae bacterium]
MSRIWIGIALLSVAATCGAQVGRAPELPAGPGTDADVRAKNPDPSAVEIPLYAGALISDVLKALVEKGFLIKWSPEQVLPTMTVLERPKATRIDNVLNEILAPWGMRADHNLMDGGYRIKTMKKKKSKD